MTFPYLFLRISQSELQIQSTLTASTLPNSALGVAFTNPFPNPGSSSEELSSPNGLPLHAVTHPDTDDEAVLAT